MSSTTTASDDEIGGQSRRLGVPLGIVKGMVGGGGDHSDENSSSDAVMSPAGRVYVDRTSTSETDSDDPNSRGRLVQSNTSDDSSLEEVPPATNGGGGGGGRSDDADGGARGVTGDGFLGRCGHGAGRAGSDGVQLMPMWHKVCYIVGCFALVLLTYYAIVLFAFVSAFDADKIRFALTEFSLADACTSSTLVFNLGYEVTSDFTGAIGFGDVDVVVSDAVAGDQILSVVVPGRLIRPGVNAALDELVVDISEAPFLDLLHDIQNDVDREVEITLETSFFQRASTPLRIAVRFSSLTGFGNATDDDGGGFDLGDTSNSTDGDLIDFAIATFDVQVGASSMLFDFALNLAPVILDIPVLPFQVSYLTGPGGGGAGQFLGAVELYGQPSDRVADDGRPTGDLGFRILADESDGGVVAAWQQLILDDRDGALGSVRVTSTSQASSACFVERVASVIDFEFSLAGDGEAAEELAAAAGDDDDDDDSYLSSIEDAFGFSLPSVETIAWREVPLVSAVLNAATIEADIGLELNFPITIDTPDFGFDIFGDAATVSNASAPMAQLIFHALDVDVPADVETVVHPAFSVVERSRTSFQTEFLSAALRGAGTNVTVATANDPANILSRILSVQPSTYSLDSRTEDDIREAIQGWVAPDALGGSVDWVVGPASGAVFYVDAARLWTVPNLVNLFFTIPSVELGEITLDVGRRNATTKGGSLLASLTVDSGFLTTDIILRLIFGIGSGSTVNYDPDDLRHIASMLLFGGSGPLRVEGFHRGFEFDFELFVPSSLLAYADDGAFFDRGALTYAAQTYTDGGSSVNCSLAAQVDLDFTSPFPFDLEVRGIMLDLSFDEAAGGGPMLPPGVPDATPAGWLGAFGTPLVLDDYGSGARDGVVVAAAPTGAVCADLFGAWSGSASDGWPIRGNGTVVIGLPWTNPNTGTVVRFIVGGIPVADPILVARPPSDAPTTTTTTTEAPVAIVEASSETGPDIGQGSIGPATFGLLFFVVLCCLCCGCSCVFVYDHGAKFCPCCCDTYEAEIDRLHRQRAATGGRGRV